MKRDYKDLKQPFATQIKYSTLLTLRKFSLETERTISEITETALREHLEKNNRVNRDNPEDTA